MEKIIEDFESSDFWKFMGLELEHIEKGNVTLKLPIISSFHNVKKSVHGGIYASILDTTMGFTVRTASEFDELVTLEMDVHFLKAVSEGAIYCTAEIINRSNSTALVQGKLYNDKEELIAHSTGTFRGTKE